METKACYDDMAVMFQGLLFPSSLCSIVLSVVSAFVCLDIHIWERYLEFCSLALQISLPGSEMHFDILLHNRCQ